MAKARGVVARYPDVRSSVGAISPLGGGGGRNAELSFNLVGPDLERLTTYSEALVKELRQNPGLADVDTTLSNRKPELQVRIDREKASQFGLRITDIAATLRTLVGGEIIGVFKENDEQHDVWLRADAVHRGTAEALQQVFVRTRPGGASGARPEMVPLGNFVRFEEARGPNQIDRFQRQRRVTLVANLGTYSLGEAVQEVERVVARMDLPPEYQVVMVGRAKQLRETLTNFLMAFLVAVVFMYMVLAAQFEHFIYPISILLAVPLSLPFALAWMVFIHEQLNIYAIFGLFMLVGIVKKNGIMQIDYTRVLRERGVPRDEAILEANQVRLRPILMTTLLLVASMVPIALGVGPGAAGRASMAKVIIGGQMLCLLLTLLVTPVSYAIFDDWGRRLLRRGPGEG
jgi:HAE1 family hydrophobic/amphiphilic exporter-1